MYLLICLLKAFTASSVAASKDWHFFFAKSSFPGILILIVIVALTVAVVVAVVAVTVAVTVSVVAVVAVVIHWVKKQNVMCTP